MPTSTRAVSRHLTSAAPPAPRSAAAGSWVARLLVVACLAVDAYVHAHLAPDRWVASGRLLNQGELFAAEAVAAALVGLALLVTGRTAAWTAAAVVALGGFAAVVLYRYVDVPALGPLPAMFEPLWYGEKTLSAVAEALGGLVALGMVAARLGRGRRAPTAGS